MPGAIMTLETTVLCQHSAQAKHYAPAQPRVRINGQFALTQSDIASVVTPPTCPFAQGNKPSPCVTIQWQAPAVRVKLSGMPALLDTSFGDCRSGENAPQGKATVIAVPKPPTQNVKGM